MIKCGNERCSAVETCKLWNNTQCPFFEAEKPENQKKKKPKKAALPRPTEDGERKRNLKIGQSNGFIIGQKLPSLNEYQTACRANRYTGARFKKETEAIIEIEILKALKSKMLIIPIPPIKIAFIWHEKTKKRDADNIASAKKYILDAMQTMGIIENDNRKNVVGFTDEVVDDTRDFVEVKIFEV